MSLPPSIGTGFLFKSGFQDFLAEHTYGIVAIEPARYIVVEINLRKPMVARYVRSFGRLAFLELLAEGKVSVEKLPDIPTSTSEAGANKWTTDRIERLRPVIDQAHTILSSPSPAKACNAASRGANLNITRTRALFFWMAAYAFEEEALSPAFWNCASKASKGAKRGRKVLSPEATMQGWAYNPEWDTKIMKGWRIHSSPGRTYRSVYADTLTSEFKCVVDTSTVPASIFHPDGDSFPTWSQFKRVVQQKIGQKAWAEAKYGAQTIRNRAGQSHEKVGQYLINLLEEVQWDAQILKELPGDLLDPSQPGRPIVRVSAVCATCGGQAGVGYDYGTESKWAYLMALLSMAMKKSEFGGLFGVEISDEDWPATGLMLAIRSDRGPAIGQSVSDIIATVLNIWQEWAASYDPVGKPNAESGHWKHTKVDGAPARRKLYRSPVEIIRDDLRKTAAKFRSADMSHRLDPDQARRRVSGTPAGIWKDLASRGLYAGQQMGFEKIARLTLPRHEVSIHADGVHLGVQRYLSDELVASQILDRARGDPIDSYAYVMNMVTKTIWLDLHGRLVPIVAVPVRINALEVTHSLTFEEALLYANRIAESRRIAEHDQLAMDMVNSVERQKDRVAIESVRQAMAPAKSKGKSETIDQHRTVLMRKK